LDSRLNFGNNGARHALSFPIEGQKGKKQKPGFPTKDFGNDGKYYKGALPPHNPPKEKSMKTKEKDQK